MSQEIARQSTQVQVGNQPPLPPLPVEYVKTSIHIDSIEKSAYIAQHRAAPFRNIPEPERATWAAALVYRISIITGCPAPAEKIELEVLENELVCVFAENVAYSSLNIEEVALAFRLNATGEGGDEIKHFNKVLHLEYLGKVLRRYINLREGLENKVWGEKKKLNELPAPVKTRTEHDEDTEHVIQYHYECFCLGQLQLDFILEFEYELLDRRGLMQLDKETKDMLMSVGMERRLQYLRDNASSKNDFTYLAQQQVDFSNNYATPTEHKAIAREAKRIAVWDFFADLQALGISNVFEVKTWNKILDNGK